ncbi:HET-domain-containing protein [Plenodomus tracheiphilus IPT5]|uniref:HET-domain-containing protein n=1 Tax=Plenodomus tracheiphilus IPT5 TaxID=1408161 RepID=A0A6A7B515_9PLEO|nr:HET-domain-containing protein [Plenodomus tracheiphilus IPT5]
MPGVGIAKLLPGSTCSQSTTTTIASWFADCLANHHEFRTCRSDLKLHLESGVAIDTLPKTFHDAILICQNLSIEYLWIDSLCIIQDDEADWQKQAALMADVYEGAIITIAAAHAENPTRGCFSNIRAACRGQPLPGYTNTYVRPWPLLQRGWVFQEVSLSPRVIYFGAEEVVWQCRCKVEREGHPNEPWLLEKIRAPVLSLTNYDTTTLDNYWFEVVRRYSSRSLSRQMDCLPAIAAMARRIERLRPRDRYLAGLWQSSLCRGLSWENVVNVPNGAQEEAIKLRLLDGPKALYGVPTWSWASTHRPVYFIGHESPACAEVLNIDYTIDGPAVSGTIRKAALTLRAPLVTLKDIRIKGIQSKDLSTRDIDNALRDTQSKAACELAASSYSWDNHGHGVASDHTQHCFALVLNTTQKAWYSRHFALIIKQVGQTGTYIRLGTVHFHFAGWYIVEQYERECEGNYIQYDEEEVLRAKETYETRFKAHHTFLIFLEPPYATLTMSNSLNYPLLAIPAYYAFSLVPHAYASSILTANGYKINNANPKASLSPDAVKGKVPDAVFQKYQRAENAQANNLEQLPLFAVAILASIIAERTTAAGIGRDVVRGDALGLSTFIAAFFLARSAYGVAYVQIADHSKSFIRSSFYSIGAGLSIYQIYKAAALLG